MPRKKANTVETLLPYLTELIEGIKPQLLAAHIKESETLEPVVLRGFRATAQAMKALVVRQRLMAEAEKDVDLLNELRVLWIDSNRSLWGQVALSPTQDLKNLLGELIREHGMSNVRIALLLDDRYAVNALASRLDDSLPVEAAPIQAGPPAQERRPVERSERDPSKAAHARYAEENKRLKDKAKLLESRVRDLERVSEKRLRNLERSQSELRMMKQQLAEMQKLLSKNMKAMDRLQRAKDALDQEKALVERELKRTRKESEKLSTQKAAIQSQAETSAQPRIPVWVPYISAMLGKGQYEAVAAFCESARDAEPNSPHAHIILEQIHARMENGAGQADESLWLAGYFMKHGQPVRACTFTCRALEIDPTSSRAQLQLRDALGEINLSDESAVSAVRGLIGRLKVSNLQAYREARKVVRQLGKEYLRALEGRSGILHLDKVLNLTDGNRAIQLSVRRIIEAVDGNEVQVVKFVRRALANLRATRPTLYSSIMKTLEAHDQSCVAALNRGTQPIVVDGSNVAWYQREEKPRLKNILDLRSELRAEGYFPVYIYVDASLPYQVDQQAALLQLIDAGVVAAANSRTDADETITEQARRLACPVVTNDRMVDWDPEDSIPKYRFAIDRFGVTVYER